MCVPLFHHRWSAAVYGGASARPQLAALAAGAEIVVATPGRLADLLHRRPPLLSLAKCEFLVLDEADRMLDMPVIPELYLILVEYIVWCFSAEVLPKIHHFFVLIYSSKQSVWLSLQQ